MNPSSQIGKQGRQPKDAKHGALQRNPSFLPQTETILTRGLRNGSNSAPKKRKPASAMNAGLRLF
jgi:hypothetical protein